MPLTNSLPSDTAHDPRQPTPLEDVVVLIPAYNCQPGLERTLASLREGTPLKVLIVDDGSTPAIVAPKLPQLHIEVMRLASNRGIEHALRSGCEFLFQRGVRFIARIDAGDLAAPGRFARQRQYLDQHPAVGAVGTWADGVSMNGQFLFTLRPPTDAATIRRQRFFRCCFVHPAMMLRAEAVAQAGNYRDKYPAAEDLDLFLRIMERYDFANLAEVGLFYEVNQNSLSATRHREQVASTLRLQLRYVDPLNPYYWLSLIKYGMHLVLPFRARLRIKQVLFG